MASLWYGLGALGDLLELVLLWRILRERQWRRYPFFLLFVLCLVSSTIIQSALLALYGYNSHTYAVFYWASDLVGTGLWSFVAWEIFRHSFPRGSSVRAVVGTVALALAAAITGLLFLEHGGLRLPPTTGYLALNFGRYASLVMAPLVLWLVAAASYYRIPLGRNVWGMAIGFGAFLSLSAINGAMYLLGHSSWLLSSITTPAAFVLQLAIWTWALWRYVPNPPLGAMPREQAREELLIWKQEWNRLLAIMRKENER